MMLEHAVAFRLRSGGGGERAGEGAASARSRTEDAKKRRGRAPGFALGVVCTALMRTTSSSRESRLFAA